MWILSRKYKPECHAVAACCGLLNAFFLKVLDDMGGDKAIP